MRLTFFHIPKPRRFNYQPVFYDEAKERRMERERRIREEMGLPQIEGEEIKLHSDRIRQNFSSGRRDLEFTRRASRRSNTRIIVIAALLLFLLYFMVGTRIENIFNLFKF